MKELGRGRGSNRRGGGLSRFVLCGSFSFLFRDCSVLSLFWLSMSLDQCRGHGGRKIPNGPAHNLELPQSKEEYLPFAKPPHACLSGPERRDLLEKRLFSSRESRASRQPPECEKTKANPTIFYRFHRISKFLNLWWQGFCEASCTLLACAWGLWSAALSEALRIARPGRAGIARARKCLQA